MYSLARRKPPQWLCFWWPRHKFPPWLITIAELPMMVSDLLQPLVDSPRLLFIVIMVAILIVGMVMDLTPTVLILTPVLMPLVKEAGNRSDLFRCHVYH